MQVANPGIETLSDRRDTHLALKNRVGVVEHRVYGLGWLLRPLTIDGLAST
jgi:hypothetical protein